LPVLDTQVLFALNPADRKHASVSKLLSSGKNLIVPDVSLLEYELVLKARGRKVGDIRQSLLAISKILTEAGVDEARTINSFLLGIQMDFEDRLGLSFFDSLIAASALSLDSVVISDDPSFDSVPGLTRKPL
jgi:predicted nucleic acid-binding protein